MKKTALVICPGRGTYNKPELGSIYANIAASSPKLRETLQDKLDAIDAEREALGLPTVTELDQAKLFKTSLHQRPENAAALIYAAGYLDFLSIDREQYEVVALTGNSMGWYTAMACADAWSLSTSTKLVTSMAQLTAGGAGAQFIYPIIDSEWRPDAKRIALVEAQVAAHPDELMHSINYGGYAVLAGTEAACNAAIQALPTADERFPMLLPGHAAFHTRMMSDAATEALETWPVAAFHPPQTPLVDGRGFQWLTPTADMRALQRYTLGHQVTETYDFSKAVQVAVKDYAPDHIILLGPGSGLGGAVAQALIAIGWQGLTDKASFTAQQKAAHPYVLSMGLPEQRALVTAGQT
ncbi:malonyl CoA-ACP transacylase [Pseudidiomarina sp. 1APP75-32.1]|uniref:[acyl-carrier-protein] S-malonyltransferase n=1 Tax=Pseudidiomarina terrestris TaxID=2820060 RepID=A0AAW7R1A9_9GAMM|nr:MULTISPECIES: malonyl CoA-ACP transacylase [unclassified Pseudidiomarina]MDN7124727.1 malonyl CoA-ACP transacylase [Pseudidiomarina sp. 1APP75-32.1]MDN7129799.1 malonyl CoA-ACP transacylase [Pseudidiomarina sp. 1APR75-15]MDN7137944.1 malonyl CoA-ACP transacylase [Pseudidiomarina sp. 1ASP75-14]